MSVPHSLTRRAAIALACAAAVATPARALTPAMAEGFIQEILVDLRSLIDSRASGPEGAQRFLDLLEDRAALEQVGKFAMGRVWRDMSPAQQGAYQDAFRGYISRTYMRRFNDYAGEDIVVNGSVDAGQKGVLVKSVLKRPTSEDIAVEWLVTDRLGPPKLADIIFEGVSLSITLRETFGGMIEKRGGDVDQFIADLSASDGA